MAITSLQDVAADYNLSIVNLPARIQSHHESGAFFVNIHEGSNVDILSVCEERRKNLEGKILIGIAGELNLTLLASARLEGAVICTPDSAQRKMWESVFDLIKKCPRPEAFFSFWEDVVLGERDYPFFKDSNEAHFFDRANSAPEMYWLHDENYAYVRELVHQGAFTFLSLDLLNVNQCSSLGSLFEERSIDVGICYVSNILSYYVTIGKLGQGYLGDPAPKTMEEMLVLAENIQRLTHSNDTLIVDGSFNTRRWFESCKEYGSFLKGVWENRLDYVAKEEPVSKTSLFSRWFSW